VLHCMLQDHLGAAVTDAFPEASNFVVSSDQLAKGNISPAAVSGLSSILLYTSQAGLAAYDVVAGLQEAGVPASEPLLNMIIGGIPAMNCQTSGKLLAWNTITAG